MDCFRRNLARFHSWIDHCRLVSDWFYLVIYATISCNIYLLIHFLWIKLLSLTPIVRNADDPDDRATLYRILFTWDYTSLYACKPEAFITLHEGYSSVDIVLADNVTLLWVDATFAYFVQLPQPVHEYNALRVGFFFNAVYSKAIKLIKVPIELFLKLSRKLQSDANQLQIVFVLNSGRCGGTLLTQLMQAVFSDALCLNEHDILLSLLPLSEQLRNNHQRYKQIVEAVFVFMRKPYKAMPLQRYVYKLSTAQNKLLDYQEFCFPKDAKLIHLTRQPQVMLRSWYRLFSGLFSMEYAYYQNYFWRIILRNAFYSYPNAHVMEPDVYSMKPNNSCEYAILRWAILTSHVQRASNSQKAEFLHITYENLLLKPCLLLKDICLYIGTEDSAIDETKVLAVLARDSQNDHSFSQDWMKRKTGNISDQFNAVRHDWLKALVATYDLKYDTADIL